MKNFLARNTHYRRLYELQFRARATFGCLTRMPDSTQPSSEPAPADSSQQPHPFSQHPRFPFREEIKIRVWASLTFALLWLLKVTTRKQYIGADDLFARWNRGEQVINGILA